MTRHLATPDDGEVDPQNETVCQGGIRAVEGGTMKLCLCSLLNLKTREKFYLNMTVFVSHQWDPLQYLPVLKDMVVKACKNNP
jgi:hypothetical protein